MVKNLSYYNGLPYTRRIRLEDDQSGEYFVAFVKELSGLESDGVTEAEAWYNLQQAFDDYVGAMISGGHEIAEPELWPPTSVTVRAGLLRTLTAAWRKPREVVVAPAHASTFEDTPEDWTQTSDSVTTSGRLAAV